MLINGVKITLVICLTILVSFILFISYNEYLNRYTLASTSDNCLYIFDKKSSILNRCSEKGCEIIETKLPEKVNFGIIDQTFSPSKMFSAEKSMGEAIVKAKPVETSEVSGKSAKDFKQNDDSQPRESNKAQENSKSQNKQEKPEEKLDDKFIE